ncbi:MAG: hypothetical protein IT212_05055 [Bacteroidia bacterium]|nr:hypothetical protein [Bacteroidia bacterium]
MKYIFIILLTIAIIVTGIFLPYIHGDYDNFAVGLSYIFQFALFASLLFVPTGLIWLTLNFTIGRNTPTVKYSPYFKKITLIIATIIVLATALGAFASNNRFPAIIILGGGIFLFTFRKKIKTLFYVSDNIKPYYFIFIPLAVLVIRMIFLETVKNKTTDYVGLAV